MGDPSSSFSSQTPREPSLQKTRRRLPHWALEEGTSFITFRLGHGTLSPEERTMVLNHLRAGNGLHDRLASAVVMPDHVHLALRPAPGFALPRIMKGIKGVSARLVNQHRGRLGPLWQEESWDRLVRDEAEFLQKLQSIVAHPVRAGLAREPEDYPWLFVSDDL